MSKAPVEESATSSQTAISKAPESPALYLLPELCGPDVIMCKTQPMTKLGLVAEALRECWPTLCSTLGEQRAFQVTGSVAGFLKYAPNAWKDSVAPEAMSSLQPEVWRKALLTHAWEFVSTDSDESTSLKTNELLGNSDEVKQACCHILQRFGQRDQ